MKTGATVRHELLIRLFDGKEMLAPGLWLPAAERGGLIGEIDRWVTEQALKLVGDGQPVSVNLSAHAIQDPELTDFVERELAANRADPSRLMFEITETSRRGRSRSSPASPSGSAGSAVGWRSTTSAPGSPRSPTSSTCGPTTSRSTWSSSAPSPHHPRTSASSAPRGARPEHGTADRGRGRRGRGDGRHDQGEFGVDFGQGYHFGRPEPTPIPGQLGHWLPLSSA